MKKLKFLLGILFLLSLNSCSSDDDSSEAISIVGKMAVNGVEYDLTKGFIIPNPDGSDPNFNPRRFYFILANGNVTYANDEFVYSDEITQLIDFNMYTSIQSSGNVENTTYPILNTNDPNFSLNNAYIDHSGINTNVVIQNQVYISSNSLSSDDMTQGQATINLVNGVYTITFSFSNNNNVITGNFTGTMTNLN
ncbi:hypothetical protein [uncultured Flavobacterium sp.]|uniref:hypothetical protein n=1 Tax=uncultured Flavobacterium sp. TaxID=165435 RepID=UPI0030C84CE2